LAAGGFSSKTLLKADFHLYLLAPWMCHDLELYWFQAAGYPARALGVCNNDHRFQEYSMKTKFTIGILFLLAICAAATPAGLPWINDNYPKALVEGKQRKLPIFVEVWAPW